MIRQDACWKSACLAIAVAILAMSSALAATNTWLGAGNANWSTVNNWSNVGGLAMDDSIRFDANSTANLSSNNDLVTWQVAGIAVVDPPANIALGGNPFTLGAGGIALAGNRNLTVSITPQVGDVGTTGQLTIGTSQTWTIPAGRTVTMSALKGASDKTILITGGGKVEFIPNQVSINWAGTIHLENVHMLTQHDLGGDPNNSLGSGTFILENARLDLNGNKGTQTMPADVIVGGDSTIGVGRGSNSNTTAYTFASLAISDSSLAVPWIGTYVSKPAATLAFSSVALDGAPIFDVADSNVTLSLGSQILNPNNLANGFVKTGPGVLTITGSGTGTYQYGGPIVVQQGVVRVGTASSGSLGGAAGRLVLQGGTFESLNNAAVTYNTPVSAYGSASLLAKPNGGDRAGAAHTFGQLDMYGASLTLLSNSQITSGTQRIVFNASATRFDQGASTVIVNRNGATALRVETGSNWQRLHRSTMHVDIRTDSTVFRSAPVALAPDGARLPMTTIAVQSGPILFARTDGTDVLPLSSYASLPTSGGNATTAYQLDGGAGLVGNTAAFLLRVDATGTGQSLDLGGNTLALNYNGGVGQGGLLFSGASAYAITGGTIDSQGAELIVHQYNTGGVTLAALLDLGTGGLTKTGPGSLTVATPQTYAGPTYVNQGILALAGTGSLTGDIVLHASGTLALTAATGNAYTLPTGTTLSGVGTVALGNTDLTIVGTVSPGFSPGELTFTSTGGNLIVSPTGRLIMEITGFEAGNYDTIVLTDGTFIAGGTLELINLFAEPPEVGTTIQLFEVAGNSFSGSFANILNRNFGEGFFWDTSLLLINGSIVAAIPEPSSALLLALLATGLSRRTRSRRQLR